MTTKQDGTPADFPEAIRDGAAISAQSSLGNRPPLDRASDLCEEFVRLWRAEGPIRVEAFLDQRGEIELGGDDECELIYTEYLLREADNQAPIVEEYLERFPAQADRLRRQLMFHRLMDETGPARALADSTIDDPGPTNLALVAAPIPHRWPAPAGYLIERVLGRGGMGVVYQARQIRLNRVVALKMIRAGAHASPEAATRFLAEAEVIARFQHPHIVGIHAAGDCDGQPYFEMEYVAGGSLAAQLDGTPRPARDAVALVEILARTMHEAHGLGIVHRDLKPANILMTPEGSPKIADFGLAKLLHADSGLTQTESALGSPGYMAPEQTGGDHRAVGPTADVYALGVILYELLTGRPPFAAPSVLETLDLVRHAEPVPPSRLRPGLPRDAETIVLRCLSKEPTRRYPSADALAQDLAHLLAGRPIVARPVGAVERAWRWARRNVVLACLIGAVFASLLGGISGMAVFWSRALSEARNARDQVDLTNGARRAEQATRGEVERLSAGLTLERGLSLAGEGHVYRGLHFLAETLRIDPTDRAGLAQVARRNLSAWTTQLPQVLRTVALPEGTWAGYFSPDGRSYAAVGRDGRLRIWDQATLRVVEAVGATLDLHARLLFRDDGQVLASGQSNGELHFWDVATGRLLGQPLRLPATDLHLSGRFGGRNLLVRSRTRCWIVPWDQSEPLVGPIECGEGIMATSFVPEQSSVLIGLSEGSLQRRDATTGKLESPPIHFDEHVQSVTFSPDGDRFVVGFGSHLPLPNGSEPRWGAQVFDARTNQRVGPVLIHPTGVQDIVFQEDGSSFLTSDFTGITRVWDRDGRALAAPMSHEGTQTQQAISPDGQFALLGSNSGLVQLWDLRAARPVGARIEMQGFVDVRFGADGRTIAVADNRRLAVYDVGSLLQPAPAVDGQVVAFRFRDDRSLFTTTVPGTARLWEIASGRPLSAVMTHADRIDTLDALPDGSLVATGGRDRTVRLWDGLGHPIGEPINLPHWVLAVKLVNQGRGVLVGCANNTTRLFATADGQPVGPAVRNTQRSPGSEVRFLLVKPDGATALSVSRDGTVARVDLRSGRQIGELFQCHRFVRRAKLSPDGRWFLVLGDGLLRVCDTTTGTITLSVPDLVSDADFAPDSRSLITGGVDSMVHRWDLASGRVEGSPLELSRPILAVVVGPDNRLSLIVTDDSQAQFWDLTSREPIGAPWRVSSPEIWGWPVFAPDGQSVAVRHGSLEVHPVPIPREGTAAEIRREVRRATRIDLNDRGGAIALDFPDPLDTPPLLTNHDWHVRTARMDLLETKPTAALWHLDRLATGGEGDWFLRAQKAFAHALLDQDSTVSAELAEIDRQATPASALIAFSSVAIDSARAGHWRSALEGYNRFLARRPDDANMLAERGWAYAQLRDWRSAQADLDLAYRRWLPPLELGGQWALIARMAGDSETARAILRRFQEHRLQLTSPSPQYSLVLCWLLAVIPDAPIDSAVALRWASLGGVTTPEQADRTSLVTTGALLYRAGRPGEAIGFLDRAERELATEERAQTWPFLAMAHARLGHRDEARHWLDRLDAEPSSAPAISSAIWNGLDMMILREEARAVILGSDATIQRR